jgi:hypothetical protein
VRALSGAGERAGDPKAWLNKAWLDQVA